MQQTIFDMLYPKFKITKPIRLIELFAGYGSQALALKYLNVPFEHWKICEWAIKSTQAYKDIHFTDIDIKINSSRTKEDMVNFLYQKGISSNWNEPMTKEQINRLSEEQLKTIIKNIAITHNLVNIQQVKGEDLEIVDTDKYEYIMTYSFPCQDLSLAGKKQGMSDTSTRSGMLWEVERILQECKDLGTLPQVLLMENVPQVHSQDNVEDFNKWKSRLEELGYMNYFQDLSATDYGVPQTRVRTFMVSILGEYSYIFPQKEPLNIKLRDLLEDNADKKYYLTNKQIEDVSCWNAYEKPLENMEKIEKTQVSPTLTTRSGAYAAGMILVKPQVVGGIGEKKSNGGRQYYQQDRIYDDNVAISLATSFNPYYKIGNEVDNKYYLSDKMVKYISSKSDKYTVNDNNLVINRDVACSKTTREGCTRADTSDYICNDLPSNTKIIGTYQFAKSDAFMKGKNRFQEGKEVADTIQTSQKEGIVNSDLRIRKLTPRECLRLMGVSEQDITNMSQNQSDNSLYHLAGDSIVVNVLMAIFKEMM